MDRASTFRSPRHLPSTSMTFLCVHGTFFKLAAQPQDLCQLPSTLRASTGPSINFLCIRGTVCQLPSTFCVCGTLKKRFMQPRLFHQLSVQSRDLPSAFHASMGPSINFPYVRGTFHELPSTFRASEGPSVSFPCVHGTFHQLSVCQQDSP